MGMGGAAPNSARGGFGMSSGAEEPSFTEEDIPF
jgi:hypothetical protein